jgi:hypothetical protein
MRAFARIAAAARIAAIALTAGIASSTASAIAVGADSDSLTAVERPGLPRVSAPIPESSVSHAFSASTHQQKPLDLGKSGYLEAEYLLSGEARVYDWGDGQAVRVLARGPYTTRILIRRPADMRRFSGVVIVEPMNPSEDIDLPIMWAESYRQFIAEGDAWVGITIKPNTIRALKLFDPARYAGLGMPNPRPGGGCPPAQINAFSQPTTAADETGLAWDILSEVGALLKSSATSNPLTRAAARLYMTGQSQTAGYARLYASLFNRREVGPDGKPLYDGFLYSGSPPWQVPINQCRRDFPSGDSRLITAAAGVPVVEIFTQGDMTTNEPTRRPDSDAAPDLFRRYEVAGAPHVDPWEMLSFASDADAAKAHGRLRDNEAQVCSPKGVEASDFPVRHIFDAAWRLLDDWVRRGVDAPHAPRLEMVPDAARLPPDRKFVLDRLGNARGGVRLPIIEVPTARWVGAKAGPFLCLFHGYKIPFDEAQLRRLYPTHAAYVSEVRSSAAALARDRWLTAPDAAEVVHTAEAASVP